MFERTLGRAVRLPLFWRIASVNAAVAFTGWSLSWWLPMLPTVLAVPGIVLSAWFLLHVSMLQAAVQYYFRYLEWTPAPLTWRHVISVWLVVSLFSLAFGTVIVVGAPVTASLVWLVLSVLAVYCLTWNVRHVFWMKDMWKGRERRLTPHQIQLLRQLELVLGFRVVVNDPESE